MIVAEQLTKAYRQTVAVAEVSFEVAAGEVVGLLGPAGAGKTTILKMLVGLIRPDAGAATILGKPYAALERPLQRVGALLGSGVQPARTVRDHLRIACARGELPERRVDAVLATVGLQDSATVRAGALSEGERTRLAIATALVGEPDALILDEPGRGLDSEGMRWLHDLVATLAERGCAVVLAGRSLVDVGQLAADLLVLDRGRLIARSSLTELVRRAGSEVLVRSPDAEALADELRDAGIAVSAPEGEVLCVYDVPPRVVSELAVASGVPVWEIRSQRSSADEALEELIHGARSANGGAPQQRDDDVDPELEETEALLDAKLAQLPRSENAQIVAMVAPGAGAGRTTLAFLLADVLAAASDRRSLAVALSCDHERLSLPVVREQRTTLALDDLLADLPQFDDTALISPYVAPAPSGAHVLCGPRRAQELAALQPAEIDALLQFAGRFYDLLVLDVGDLAEPALRAVVRHADEVLLVGAAGESDAVDPHAPVLAIMEAERDHQATIVLNRVEAGHIDNPRTGLAGSYALVPDDRELIRALDAGDFELARVAPQTRIALKRLALLVAGRSS